MNFSGVIKRIKFSGERGFYIISFKVDGGDEITAKGYISGSVSPGSWINFDGEYVDDKKWGKQINITTAPSSFDEIGVVSLVNILISFNEIHAAMALSKTTVDKITINWDDLESIKICVDSDINSKIVSSLKRVRVDNRIPDSLRKIGVPNDKISEIINMWGPNSLKRISENPWSLSEIDGISVDSMDSIASIVGVENPVFRISGLLKMWVEKWCSVSSCISSRDLLNRIVSITNADVADVIKSVKSLVEDNIIVVDKKIDDPPAIYPYNRWAEEVYCSEEICSRKFDSDFLSRMVERSGLDVDSLINRASESILLNEDQKHGIRNIINNPVSVITGLPGTGKSTSVLVITRMLRNLSVRCCLLAPTGVAAKRLSKITGMQAKTIHRGLGAKPSRETSNGVMFDEWKFNIGNPIPEDVIIIDESSMIDQQILYRIIQASSRRNSRLVFIGDPAQLPSVGYGNTLRDLIRSNKIPTTFLDKIYRQDERNRIIFASHDIFNGNFPKIGGEFMMINCDSDMDIHDKIIDTVVSVSGNGMTWQVLSPRYSTIIGVDSLNSSLRDELNPSTKSLKMGNQDFRTDDRIMVIKNDYELDICNGDTGTIKNINYDKKIVDLLLDIEGTSRIVSVKFNNLLKLVRLSYACTVHKYQGMEIDVVIMPMSKTFGNQLCRNLLYTAVTRAKKLVYLVGDVDSLHRSILNNREDDRKTYLWKRIEHGNRQ